LRLKRKDTMLHVKETLRKSIHLFSLVIPFGYRFILKDNRKLMFYVMLAALAIMLVIEFYRFWQKSFRKTFWWIFGLMLRRHELRDFTGATYLLFSAMLCVAFFEPVIVFFALSFLALGDTFAAMVGINMGRRKVGNGKKSLEGSLACFVVCFSYALLFGLHPDFYLHPVVAFTGALAATLAELSRLPVDDNVEMPLVSALAMTLAKIIF